MPSRKCSSLSIIGFICCIFIIGYAFLTLQETQKVNEIKEHEIVKRRDHENVLKEQLKVVYHHAQRVEEELKKEREKHKKTRIDFLEAKKEFYSNLTKSKHEAWTRFKALDSDHKMLKAEHEETKISYTSLQAQYKRLSTDHQRIVKQNKEDYSSLKDSKDRESMSLQDRVQELHKKYVYYQDSAEKHRTYGKQMKEYYVNCTTLAEKLTKQLKKYIISKGSKSGKEVKTTQKTTEKVQVAVQQKQVAVQQQQTDDPAISKPDDGDDEENADVGNHRYAGKAGEAEISNNHRYGNIKSKKNLNKEMKKKKNGGSEKSKSVTGVTGSFKDNVETTTPLQKKPQVTNDLANQQKEIFHKNNIQHRQLELPGGKAHDDSEVERGKDSNGQLELPGGKLLEDNSLDSQGKDVNSQVEMPGKDNQYRPAQRQHLNGQLDLPGNENRDSVKHRHDLNGRLAKSVDVERLDVKKVTLEDDEKGDQNLDKDATAGGAGEQKETDNEVDSPIKIDEDETEEKMLDEDEEEKK